MKYTIHSQPNISTTMSSHTKWNVLSKKKSKLKKKVWILFTNTQNQNFPGFINNQSENNKKNYKPNLKQQYS